ncbi:MAG: sigma 54-interacting transcriptional regulator [Kofleriaceae bacterium]
MAARFKVRDVLGHGAQGQVLLVDDRDRPGKPVALKAVGAAARGTLVREFARLAELAHPALPVVHDVGVLDAPLGPLAAGTAFYTADPVPGRPLADVAPLPPAAVWAIAVDVATALAILHGAGLVHCDVSPANILVRDADDGWRAVLIDLGLAGPAGLADAARGTPRYLAPEALAGVVHPAGDLYGLGACLLFAAQGRPPVEGDGPALLDALVRAERPRLDRAEAPGLVDLVAELVALDPAARPRTAVDVVARAQAARAALAPQTRLAPRIPPPMTPPRAASPAAWPSTEPLLATLRARCATARRHADQPAVIVRGPLGSAPLRVVELAVRQEQIAAALAGDALTATRARLDDAEARAAPDPGADDRRGRAVAERAIAAAVARAGAVTILAVADDERADAVVAAAASARGPGLAIVVLERDRPGAPDELVVPACSPAELAALAASWCDGPVEPTWVDALHAASRGLPPLALELVTALAVDGDPRARHPATATPAALAEVRARRALAEPATARLAIALSMWTDGADLDALALALAPTALGPTLAALGAADALVADAERPTLAPLVAAALTAAAPPRLRTEMAAAVARAARDRGLPPLAWAPALLAAAPILAEAGAALIDAAEHALAHGAPRQALALADAARDHGRADGALLAARAALVVGAYDRARASVAVAAAQPALAYPARLLAARIDQRAGDLAAAETALTALVGEHPDDAEVVAPHARLMIARGRYRAAVDGVARLGAVPASAAGALCAEARATAHLYLGELVEADAHVAAALAIATSLGDPAGTGRALVVQGMIAQARDELVRASELYRAAASAARRGGDAHTAAVAEQNHAATLAERGLHGAALAVLAVAATELASLGRVAELGALDANRAVSLLAVGELDAADAAATAASARAEAAGLPVARYYATLVEGDVRRRRGDAGGAAERYRAAWALATAAALPDAGHAQRSLAEVAPDAATARAALAESARRDRSDDDRWRTCLAEARLAQRGLVAATPGLAQAAAGVAAAAEAAGRLDRAWRAGLVAGQLTAEPRAAAAHLARARRVFDSVVAATPPTWRPGLMTDPDALTLHATAAAPPPVAGSASDGELVRLRRLLALTRRLAGAPDLDRLLDEVLDTALELTTAERGFLLLADAAGGDLTLAAARGFTQDALAPTAVSRSIAQRAITSGEPVVTVDAGHDERFDGAASVAALRLRSVLAVPLFHGGVVMGCLYVDHRLRVGAFADDAAAWLIELAGIAAVAIITARLVADTRRDAAAIAALNRQLAAEIADREAELAVVRATIPTRPRRAGLEAIVGDSPAITEVLRLIERAALVALPVAISGESGTGKELCARAVHDLGPRRDRAFVAINCGALPEALLETELFGHVKGAFTGADRDRQGLFEIADGGTLFLDEIADTSPGMQAKLLRVVADGVVRRVGDTRTHTVDVRLVTASRVPLAELVATGRFRDDLRYRLDVIALALPPLRARLGDLPALVATLLGRITGDAPPPKLGRDAARALARYSWPGNIRELENALARAVALGSDPITVDDLPDPVRAGTSPAPRLVADGDLALKPAVDALERAYIEAAMARVDGNQSAAARLLGLSRFGLQKKLARLGLERKR